MVTNEIQIKISRKKLIFNLLLGLVLLLASLHMLINPETMISSTFRSIYPLLFAGILGCLFSLPLLSYIIYKLFQQIGVIINDKGLIDKTSLMSVGFIPWSEISNIRKVTIMSKDFLLIDVKNPEKYIENSKNYIQRILMKWNYKSYRTPITLNEKMLECSFSELERIIIDSFEKNKIG